jgi:hypothetical protein
MVLFFAIVAFVILGLDNLRHGWWMSVIANRSFVSAFLWLDYAYLLIWLFEFMWSLAAGFLAALVMRSDAPIAWAIALGAVGSAINFLSTSDHIGQEAPWIYPMWVYGTYLVPLLGAFVGAVICGCVRPLATDAA